MSSYITRALDSCLGKVGRCTKGDEQASDADFVPSIRRERDDAKMWSVDLARHAMGEYSFAVVQGNNVIEDHSQIEVGRSATFFGVYDGHGGPDASRYVADNLFSHFVRLASENGSVSANVLQNSFRATDDGFMTLVSRALELKPQIATTGSCCLVGVIWKGTLYVANVGDSRAVVGCLEGSRKVIAEQITNDHNASREEVRRELWSYHPDDSNILVLKQGVWRIKGIIQVSRSIGDAYLKKPEFSMASSNPRFQLSEPLQQPVLTSEPSLHTRALHPRDLFLIFASDGLWEHVSNQQAVEIVNNYPRLEVAKRLLKTAMQQAARRSGISYEDIRKVADRRSIHDDITVIVLFVNHERLAGVNSSLPELSVHGFADRVTASKFTALGPLV